MKKNFIYALVGCLAFSLAACSDDPLDATNKHVYGPDENPYISLRHWNSQCNVLMKLK